MILYMRHLEVAGEVRKVSEPGEPDRFELA